MVLVHEIPSREPLLLETSRSLVDYFSATALDDPLTQAIVHRLLNGEDLDDRNRQLLLQQLGREFNCSEFTVGRRLKYLEEKLNDRLKKLRD